MAQPSVGGYSGANVNSSAGCIKNDGSDWLGGRDSRFAILLGTYGANFNADIRVDPDTGQGSEIVLDDIPGLDSTQNVFRADALWRIGGKQRIGLSWFAADQSASWTLPEDEQIGNVLFPAGTVVDVGFDTDYFVLKYIYSFTQKPSAELAASLGIHSLGFDFSVESTAGDLSESADATAPLPMAGFYADYYPSNRWRLYLSLEALAIDIGDYSGTFTDVGAGAEYAFTKSFGVGLGYDRFTTSVDGSASNFSGHLKEVFGGFQLFAVGRF
jgi:hypothetical protein